MEIPGITSAHGLTAAEIQPQSVQLTPAERAHAAALRGAALRNADPAQQRAAVASQFEAVLVRQLLGKTMTSMMGKDSAASSVYGDLVTDTMAQKLTAGSGLGLARMIERQLTPRSAVIAQPSTSSQ